MRVDSGKMQTSCMDKEVPRFVVMPMVGNSISTTDGTRLAVCWVSEEAYGTL